MATVVSFVWSLWRIFMPRIQNDSPRLWPFPWVIKVFRKVSFPQPTARKCICCVQKSGNFFQDSLTEWEDCNSSIWRKRFWRDLIQLHWINRTSDVSKLRGPNDQFSYKWPLAKFLLSAVKADRNSCKLVSWLWDCTLNFDAERHECYSSFCLKRKLQSRTNGTNSWRFCICN